MTTDKVFNYGNQELDYLSSVDKALGDYIKQVGHIRREMYSDVFTCLVTSICGQQISSKALETVLSRLKTLVGDVTPQNLYNVGVEKLKTIGISLKKATNLYNLACKVVDGSLCLDSLSNMTNDEVISKLVELDGIGPWTAQMTLIFALERKDVFSFGDFGIKKGLSVLYGIDKIDKQIFESFKNKFSPYGTIASFYLWDIANKN